jgi:hypothetical protein
MKSMWGGALALQKALGAARRLLFAALAGAVVSGGIPPAWASPGAPTNDEYGLLVLVNELRSDPAAQGFSDPVVQPLVWDDGLAAAARYHSDDMAENGCFQHNSCNGGSWSSRIGRYYPGWEWIGENIVGVAMTPRQIHSVWVNSPGHRANMLKGAFADYGSGIAVGDDGTPYATADFGTRALRALGSIPAITAGAAMPRMGGRGSRELIASYYHYNGQAPQAVRALVGSSCIPLTRVSGKAAYGTYAATRSLSGSGCQPLVFEAIRSDGKRYRFPASDSLVIGIDAASCPERTATAPTASCGDGPLPTPTPTPPPGGGGSMGMEKVQIVLRPGPASGGKGVASVQALLAPSAHFDPRSGPVQIVVGYPGGSYAKTLPRDCEEGSCLRLSSNGAVYRARYDVPGVALSFNRTRDGRWKMRFSSKYETLGPFVDGPVALTVSAGGTTASATVSGDAGRTSLVAK